MMPWCARMKQLLEEKGVEQPPKPDFSRSLPPLLMETMDICNPAPESHEEKFMVRLFDRMPPFSVLFYWGLFCFGAPLASRMLTRVICSDLTTRAKTMTIHRRTILLCQQRQLQRQQRQVQRQQQQLPPPTQSEARRLSPQFEHRNSSS